MIHPSSISCVGEDNCGDHEVNPGRTTSIWSRPRPKADRETENAGPHAQPEASHQRTAVLPRERAAAEAEGRNGFLRAASIQPSFLLVAGLRQSCSAIIFVASSLGVRAADGKISFAVSTSVVGTNCTALWGDSY